MGSGTALNPLFVPATQAYVDAFVRTREGETKLGERIGIVDSYEALAVSPARFVLLGIPEDIGVRANYGVGGAHTLWEPALRAFLNTQETDRCSGSDVVLLGAFNFEHWMAASEGMDAERMRTLVDNIDEAVYPIIEAVVRAGKIPLVVGGGHNNAYPLLQGASYALGKPLSCINLDAHADFRRAEGRHSGNPFRYARQDGFLERYAVIGLHEAYNCSAVMSEIASDPLCLHFLFEDIFLKAEIKFRQAVRNAIEFAGKSLTGIELDLDCIANVLSSAATPSGFSPFQVRQYLHWCASEANAVYFHITEGATKLRDGREDGSTAKLVAYLLRDIISASK